MDFDGECAPAAIAHQLFVCSIVSNPISGSDVRKQCVDLIEKDAALKQFIAERLSEQTIDDYVKDMRKHSTWADDNFLYAASVLYDVCIVVIHEDGSTSPPIGSSLSGRTIKLGYVSCAVGEMPTHFISLVDKNNSIMLQSMEEPAIVEPVSQSRCQLLIAQ